MIWLPVDLFSVLPVHPSPQRTEEDTAELSKLLPWPPSLNLAEQGECWREGREGGGGGGGGGGGERGGGGGRGGRGGEEKGQNSTIIYTCITHTYKSWINNSTTKHKFNEINKINCISRVPQNTYPVRTEHHQWTELKWEFSTITTINAVKGEIICSTAAQCFAYCNTIFRGPGDHVALIEKYKLLCLNSSLGVANHTENVFTCEKAVLEYTEREIFKW